jgi:hypothetical protein
MTRRRCTEWVGPGGGAQSVTPAVMTDPGWQSRDLWRSLDYLEDNAIEGLDGISIMAAALGTPFSQEYFAAYILLAIARIRRAHRAANISEAICGAIELGEVLSDQTAQYDVRWQLGERRLKVRGNSATATHGSWAERRAKQKHVVELFNDAMDAGAVTQEQAYDIVARKVGKSARTIRRIITGS